MSLEHKDVVRMNDEYFCTACGKSWAVDDKDPPECDAVRHQSAPVRNIQNLPRAAEPVFMHARSVGKTMTKEQAIKLSEEYRKSNPHIARYWPTPLAAILQAFVVNDETMQRAMLVYAPDKNSARRYVEAMTKRADLEIRRIGAMDQYARGLSSYCEANPLTLRIAKNTSRLNVVSPASWRL